VVANITERRTQRYERFVWCPVFRSAGLCDLNHKRSKRTFSNFKRSLPRWWNCVRQSRFPFQPVITSLTKSLGTAVSVRVPLQRNLFPTSKAGSRLLRLRNKFVKNKTQSKRIAAADGLTLWTTRNTCILNTTDPEIFAIKYSHFIRRKNELVYWQGTISKDNLYIFISCD